MLELRSRAGIVAVTTGAVVFLAVPVAAVGQVPGVDQVVGGIQQTAESVAPAPLPAPPVSAPAPAPAPTPQSAAPAPAPAAPEPAAPAPAAAKSHAAPPASSGSGGSASASSSASSGSDSGAAKSGSAVKAAAASKQARASQEADDGGGEAPTDVEIATQASDTPADANAATLPFTGFQLFLVGLFGAVAVASGFTLRRAVR